MFFDILKVGGVLVPRGRSKVVLTGADSDPADSRLWHGGAGRPTASEDAWSFSSFPIAFRQWAVARRADGGYLWRWALANGRGAHGGFAVDRPPA